MLAKQTKIFVKNLCLKIALRQVVPFSLLTTSCLIGVAASSNFYSSFDNDFSEWDKQLCCEYSARIVKSPTRSGSGAVRFEHRKEDPKVRAELKLKPVPANSEQWYGYSVLIPQEFKKDSEPEVITQWHSRPDLSLDEDWRRPPLALFIKNDQFRLDNHWDSNVVTSKKEIPTFSWNLGPVEKNKWIDWVVHVKWSYKPDGLLQVWKDGRLVVERKGPNTYNDETGPFFKIGVYKRRWTTTERVIYFDEVRISDKVSGFEDVTQK